MNDDIDDTRPEGLLLTILGAGIDGLFVIDLWRSKREAGRFAAEKLLPAFTRTGEALTPWPPTATSRPTRSSPSTTSSTTARSRRHDLTTQEASPAGLAQTGPGGRDRRASQSRSRLVLAVTVVTAAADLTAMLLRRSIIPPVLAGAVLSLGALPLLR